MAFARPAWCDVLTADWAFKLFLVSGSPYSFEGSNGLHLVFHICVGHSVPDVCCTEASCTFQSSCRQLKGGRSQ